MSTSKLDRVHPRITSVVAFIANNPVRPVTNQSDPWIQGWYKENSRVFVSPTHSLWEKQKDKKISKRYGTVVKTDARGLHEMMLRHRRDVWGWIGARLGFDDEEEEMEQDAEKGVADGADIVMTSTEDV